MPTNARSTYALTCCASAQNGAVGAENIVFDMRFVGRWRVALMVHVEPDLPVTALAPLPRGLVVPMLRDVMIPTTSARLFRLVLHSAAAALHVTPQRIAAISFKCFTYSRDTRVRHFRNVLGSELFDAKISVVEKAQLSKAKITDKGGRLPFGLSVKDIGASAPKPDREEETHDGQDRSAEEADDERMLEARGEEELSSESWSSDAEAHDEDKRWGQAEEGERTG